MKTIDGWPCRRVKTHMGRKYWVKMTEEEIIEREWFRLLVAATPLILVWVFAWAAGMI